MENRQARVPPAPNVTCKRISRAFLLRFAEPILCLFNATLYGRSCEGCGAAVGDRWLDQDPQACQFLFNFDIMSRAVFNAGRSVWADGDCDVDVFLYFLNINYCLVLKVGEVFGLNIRICMNIKTSDLG